jgi:hypothetical protein
LYFLQILYATKKNIYSSSQCCTIITWEFNHGKYVPHLEVYVTCLVLQVTFTQLVLGSLSLPYRKIDTHCEARRLGKGQKRWTSIFTPVLKHVALLQLRQKSSAKRSSLPTYNPQFNPEPANIEFLVN